MLQNVTVTRTSSKTGTGKNGDWEKCGFQVNSEDVWYNYFVGKNMPKVEDGQIITRLEWEDTQYGPQVTALELSDFEPPQPSSNGETTHERAMNLPSTGKKQIGMERSVMISYVKDVACAMISTGNFDKTKTLDEVMTKILDVGERAYKTAREFDSLPEPPLRPNSMNPPVTGKGDPDIPPF